MSSKSTVKLTFQEGLQILLIWFVLMILWPLFMDTASFDGYLKDTDGYLRMVEIQRFLAGADWSDHFNARVNVPDGLYVHWTQPLTLFIVAVSAPLQLILGDQNGLYLGAALSSTLLILFTGYVVVWAGKLLDDKGLSLLGAAALFFPSAAHSYALPGRVDHHTMLVFLGACAVALSISIFTARAGKNTPYLLGTVLGLGIWVSPEYMVILGPVLASFALVWLFRINCSVACVKSAAVLFLVACIAVLLEYPSHQWFDPAYDKISIVHAVLTGMYLGMWLLLDRIFRNSPPGEQTVWKFAALALSALGVFAVLATFYTGFFEGPAFHTLDAAKTLWLQNVNEMKPMDFTTLDGWKDLLVMNSMGLLFIIMATVWWAKNSRKISTAYIPLVIVLCAAVPAGFLHIRLAQYAIPVISMILIPVGYRAVQYALSRCTRPAHYVGVFTASAAVMFGPFCISVLIAEFQEKTDPQTQPISTAGNTNENAVRKYANAKDLSKRCLSRDVLVSLNTDLADGQTIISHIDTGPAILYFTTHSVIGAPYHRGGRGIVSTIEFFNSSDRAVHKALLEQHGVDYLLLCPANTGKDKTAFEKMLMQDLPSYLEVVYHPGDDPTAGHIYKVSFSTSEK